METMNELGGVDQNAPSEVQAQLQIYRYVQFYAIMEYAPRPSMLFPLL